MFVFGGAEIAYFHSRPMPADFKNVSHRNALENFCSFVYILCHARALQGRLVKSWLNES